MTIQRIQSFPMVPKFQTLKDVETYLEDLRRTMTEDQYLRNYDIDVDTTGSKHYKFKTITGITNDVVADQMEDTLTLASGNTALTIVGTSATDTITWTWAKLGLESLADPGADRIFFWDESENASKWLACDGTTISITETTLSVLPAGLAHEFLSATHSDSTTGTVIRGDIITGQGVTPKWVRLAKGVAGYFLKADANDVTWAAHGLTYSDVGALAVGGMAADSDKWDGYQFADYLNQSVKQAASPTFVTITHTGNVVLPSSQVENQIFGIYEGSVTLIRTFRPTGAAGYNVFIASAGNSTMSPSGGASYLSSYNVAIGLDALHSNTTGPYNVAIGVDALYANTTGQSNSAIGVEALYANTTGFYNVAVGVDALYANTTGYSNSAIGVSALYLNITGHNNIAIGSNALYSNTTGYSNSAIGVNALYDITTGRNNFGLGYNIGRGITTGSNNVIIGNDVTDLPADLTDNIILASGTGTIRAQFDGTDWNFQGKVQCDSFRIDQAPTTGVIVADSYIIISCNGTNYKIPVLAA